MPPQQVSLPDIRVGTLKNMRWDKSLGLRIRREQTQAFLEDNTKMAKCSCLLLRILWNNVKLRVGKTDFNVNENVTSTAFPVVNEQIVR
jgi:hypothetical protein